MSVFTGENISRRVRHFAKKRGNLREGLEVARRELVSLLHHPDPAKRIRPREMSIRGLFEGLICDKKGRAIVGDQLVNRMNPRSSGSIRFAEAHAAVDSSYFANIMGQLLYRQILDSYNLPNYQAIINLVDTIPSNLDGERLPGIQEIGDKAEEVREGTEFPEAQIGEDWIDTPKTKKYGMIVSLTRETIFFDLTGQVIQRANKVGQWLALNKAKRILDVMCGFVNNFSWRGTTYNTYQTASPWINQLNANPFTGEASMNTSNQAFYNLTDPHTSEPISVEPDNMLFGPGIEVTVRRVFESPFIDSATTATPTYKQQSNPYYRQRYVMSVLWPARIVARGIDTANNAAGYYLRGNFREAFGYVENFPLRVDRQAAGSEVEFERDIVYRVKASERGVAMVKNPRYVQLNKPV